MKQTNEPSTPSTERVSTPLMELIERIEIARQRGGKKFRPAFDYWLHEAKSLLPKERKGYEDAFTSGLQDWLADPPEEKYNTAADYFNKTFKQ